MVTWWIAAGTLTLLSVFDIRRKEIPACVVFAGILAVAAAEIFSGMGKTGMFLGMIPGAILCMLSFLLRGRVGFGDGIVLVMCGAALGFWETIAVFFLAGVFAAVFSGVLLMRKKITMKTELPFVPFILAGYIAEVFVCA